MQAKVDEDTERIPFGRNSMIDMSPEDFDDLKKKIDDAAKDLKTKGYAVIPSLFTEEECLDFKERVWDFLDSLGLKRDLNYASIKATQLPPHSHGIMHAYRMNHAKPFRELRVNPKVLAVHSRLNGSSCLVSSLDRVNIKFPGRSYRSQGSWAHVDQNARNLGLRYVQSYVTFNECREDSPQNRFYEGSHLIFEKFFSNRRTEKAGDAWLRLSPEDRISVVKDYKCPLVKPNCPAGSMVLWDSRTIHDPDEGTDFDSGRLVGYLCYSRCFPGMKQGFKTKKTEAFSNFRATPHAPYPQTLFGKTVRTYDRDPGPHDEIPASKLGYALSEEGKPVPDEWEKYLFCFKDYQNPPIADFKRSKFTKLVNPLEKKWFGDHEVVPSDGLPLLPYVPFTVPPIPYEGEKTVKTRTNARDARTAKKRKAPASADTKLSKRQKK
jgi:hypothetical protein